MEKELLVFIIIAACAVSFGIGFTIGDAYGNKAGYKEGFDRALPLTYASVYKN